MKISLKRIFSSWGVVTGAVLGIGVGLAFHHFGFGQRAINASYDLLFPQRAPIQATDVLMVYMDDDSHERLGQRFDTPWDRRLHTRLVERLTAAGARAV